MPTRTWHKIRTHRNPPNEGITIRVWHYDWSRWLGPDIQEQREIMRENLGAFREIHYMKICDYTPGGVKEQVMITRKPPQYLPEIPGEDVSHPAPENFAQRNYGIHFAKNETQSI